MKNFLQLAATHFARITTAARELAFSKLGVVGVVFTLCYVILAMFVPAIFLVELGNALVFAFALIVFFLYFPDAVWAARNDRGEAGQYFVVGLALTILYVAETRLYGTIWRWLDYPEGWLTHPFHTFFLFACAAGLTLLMTAPGMSQGRVPLKNWKLVAGAIVFAVFVVGVTIGLIAADKTQMPREQYKSDFVHSSCPPEKPIKGNIAKNGYVYHIPGSEYYAITNPEVCFATVEDAEKSGFVAPKPRTVIRPRLNPQP